MILCCPLPPFFLGWYSSERHGHAAMQVTVPFDQSFQSENYTRKITELRKLLALPHGSSFAGHQLSAMIRDLAIQQKDGFCDMPSLHQHITQTYLERLVNITLRNFSDTIPEPVEYDPDYPDFNVEISKKMKDFDTTHLLDAEVALPFAQKLRSQLEVLARERRRINDEFGNSIANWRDVLRGCDLLARRLVEGLWWNASRIWALFWLHLNPFGSPSVPWICNFRLSFCQGCSQKFRYRSVFEIVCLVSFELHP